MESFIAKHQDKIKGILSCFDRVILKGHLPISSPEGMEAFLNGQDLLIKDFKDFVPRQAEILKAHAKAMAEKAGRPCQYLENRVRKENLVRQIVEEDGISEGLVCVLSAVEPCNSFKVAYGKNRPRLRKARRKCLVLYFYFLDRDFGLMHVRIQTWFPFTIQVYVNGHSWLARKMDRHHLGYEKLDNAFVHLDDYERAQRFADKFVDIKWLRVLDVFARRVNPLLRDLLDGMTYYWVVDQAELATDVIFLDHASLQSLYPKLLQHAVLRFSAEDVLTFLGKKLHGLFAGEVLNDYKKRWPGARVKHRMKENWIKMYDKHGVVLRIETVINHPYDFKVRRQGWRKGELVTGWFPMSKNVGNLYRYAEVSQSANQRYLEALSAVDEPDLSDGEVHRFSERKRVNERSYRGFNPFNKDDLALFAAVIRGEHYIMGFRNRDIRHLLFGTSRNAELEFRNSARVSRLLKRLHVHGLIAKIPRSRRWRVTRRGCAILSFSLGIHEKRRAEAVMDAAA